MIALLDMQPNVAQPRPKPFHSISCQGQTVHQVDNMDSCACTIKINQRHCLISQRPRLPIQLEYQQRPSPDFLFPICRTICRRHLSQPDQMPWSPPTRIPDPASSRDANDENRRSLAACDCLVRTEPDPASMSSRASDSFEWPIAAQRQPPPPLHGREHRL